ncbi:MAG: YncE family protein, partial [Actinomycetota bacterium]
VDGWFEPRLADRTGSAVILGEARVAGETAYLPAGRATTTLVLVRDDGSQRRLVLDGNFEPESFTADSTGVFVISYLPPLAPTEYQVRRLDLVTGLVEDVYSVDKSLQEAMGGTARTQAWAPDGRRLYTLYTVPVAHGERAGSRQAFVHVLSQDELWAHCVDLPAPFGDAAEDAVALAVSPAGDRLFVADRLSGTLAVVDTERLEVVRTVQQGSSPEPGPAFATTAASGPDGTGTTLWLGNGQEVSVVDGSSLGIDRSVRLSDPVVGMAPSADGRRLYVGTAKSIITLDSGTLAQVDELRAPPLQGITAVGVGAARLDSGATNLECAC